MRLSSLHLLLTYQCNLECSHCFVWGSPWQSGTMTLQSVRHILQEAQDLGTVESIYFEGGEPFLYYVLMLKGVELAADMGFKVGLVSNAYWATSVEDAVEWLRPFPGLISDLSVSSDVYHWNEKLSQQVRNAQQAAQQLEIPLGVISIAEPEATSVEAAVGKLPPEETGVMYRGRAAEALASRAPRRSWTQFTECPYEDLREPGRVHVDPFGNLHICQGISLGNMLQRPLLQRPLLQRPLLQRPLHEICQEYDPDSHPITGPLLAGGPVELVQRYELPHEEAYADACHLCEHARRALREQFPAILMPDQMYGVVSGFDD